MTEEIDEALGDGFRFWTIDDYADAYRSVGVRVVWRGLQLVASVLAQASSHRDVSVLCLKCRELGGGGGVGGHAITHNFRWQAGHDDPGSRGGGRG